MKDITLTNAPARTAVALGFFDGLHLGHIEVIKCAMQKAIESGLDSVVFTFNNKTLLPKFDHQKNIISYEYKLELLEKIGVDYLFAPDFAAEKNLSPDEFVDKILVGKLNAECVACGYDFRFAKGGKATADDLTALCEKRGIKTIVVPAVSLKGEVISSTSIRRHIMNGELEKANELLGYELTYTLEVVHGNNIGHGLGFPTINQYFPEGSVVPKNGVYKSWAQIDGKNYPSVTNIGVKPTIEEKEGEKRAVGMETHVIGYDGNLYGKHIRVGLRGFLRDERRFSGLDELKAQLETDKQAALVI